MGKRSAPTLGISPGGDSQEVSVRVRKISNGYIKSTSRYSSDGAYENTEEFTKEKPTIDVGNAAPDPMPTSSMSKAVSVLNGRK